MSSLHQLRVYQQAKAACATAYRLARAILDAALRDQMCRASASVALNISEGRGRSGDAEFAWFLSIARGSNVELEAQVAFAADVGLVEPEVAASIAEEVAWTGRILSALIQRLRAG